MQQKMYNGNATISGASMEAWADIAKNRVVYLFAI